MVAVPRGGGHGVRRRHVRRRAPAERGPCRRTVVRLWAVAKGLFAGAGGVDSLQGQSDDDEPFARRGSRGAACPSATSTTARRPLSSTRRRVPSSGQLLSISHPRSSALASAGWWRRARSAVMTTSMVSGSREPPVLERGALLGPGQHAGWDPHDPAPRPKFAWFRSMRLRLDGRPAVAGPAIGPPHP